MSELKKLLQAAFIVSASDEGGCYLGDMSAKAALSELAAKDAEIAALKEECALHNSIDPITRETAKDAQIAALRETLKAARRR